MAEQLLLRLLSLDQPEAEWALLGAEGRLEGRIDRGPLADAVPVAQGRNLAVVMPGSDALLVGARIPGRNRAKVIAAVPYALEEGLVEDVSAYHFAIGAQAVDEIYPVIVVAHSDMRRTLALLAEYDLQPTRLFAEAELLPFEADAWVLASDAEQVLVRESRSRGYRIEGDALPILLPGDPEDEQQNPQRWVVYGPIQALELPENIELDRRATPPLLELLARGLNHGPTNLLQGEYSRSQQLGKLFRPWRMSAALAATVLVAGSISLALEYRQLGRQDAELQQQIEQILQRSFPDIRRVVNARTQMQQRLKSLQAQQGESADFLKLMAAGGQAISSAPDTHIASLSYRNNRLEIELETKELPTLDQIQTRISGDIKASVSSARSENDRVRGRLRIEPAS